MNRPITCREAGQRGAAAKNKSIGFDGTYMVPVSISIREDQKKTIEELAKRTGKTKSEIIRSMIDTVVKDALNTGGKASGE